jgi:hypothetical protein
MEGLPFTANVSRIRESHAEVRSPDQDFDAFLHTMRVLDSCSRKLGTLVRTERDLRSSPSFSSASAAHMTFPCSHGTSIEALVRSQAGCISVAPTICQVWRKPHACLLQAIACLPSRSLMPPQTRRE